MKHYTPEISWHSREALNTIDMQSTEDGSYRFATAAITTLQPSIRLWRCQFDAQNKLQVDFVADLRKKHARTINVIRFSPDGRRLAAGDSESVILIWERHDSKAPDIFADDDMPPNKECWEINGTKRLRSHCDDVCDLSWSPDGRFIASVSVDKSLVIYDAIEYTNVQIIRDYEKFPNGVCWDPRGRYVATLSIDRRLTVYTIKRSGKTERLKLTRTAVVTKAVLNGLEEQVDGIESEGNPPYRLFCDDSLMSFVRRFTFTPDGEFLLTPAGSLELSTRTLNTCYSFTRGLFSDGPSVVLPLGAKSASVLRCCPITFTLRNGCEENVLKLPYRFVFAVLTAEEVFVYDTQQHTPLAHVSNIHYAPLTDLTWSLDGRLMLVCSTDGYLTVIRFDADELGVAVSDELKASLPTPMSPVPSTTGQTGRTPKTPKGDGGQSTSIVNTPPATASGNVCESPSSSSAGVGATRKRTTTLVDLFKKVKGKTSPKDDDVVVIVSPDSHKIEDATPVVNDSDAKESFEKKPRRVGFVTMTEPEPSTSSAVEKSSVPQGCSKFSPEAMCPPEKAIKRTVCSTADVASESDQKQQRLELNQKSGLPTTSIIGDSAVTNAAAPVKAKTPKRAQLITIN